MNEKCLFVCPKMDENCNTHYWSFSYTAVCKHDFGIVYSMSPLCFEQFLLKLLYVEAHDNKIQQVYFVVVGFGFL
jgi:hypothetical protein